jgi:glycosyltransferase involved in cell wall biosynthesis
MSDLAIFLTSLEGGGAERVIINLTRGLVAKGIKIDIVLGQAKGAFLPLLPPEVRLVNLNCKRLISSLPALVSYLKREKPKVMLSVLEDTNIVAIWAKALAGVSTRLVVSVHNTVSQESRNSTQLKRKLTPYLVRLFYPWANEIVTVSQGAADDLVNIGLSPKSIKVIFNPIVTPELFEKCQEPVDHPWFKPGSPPVILSVGRLEKQKDYGTLIRAFAQVVKQRSARLMILGEGKERPSLEALIKDLGITESVALPGFVTNPYSYMAAATVFVLSSLFEGLPSVLIEAMAAGTRLVSTDCESGPKEILSNGLYGKLVAVGDVQGIVEAIISSLDEPIDSEAQRKRVADFSIEKVATQYLRVFNLD